MSIVCQEKQISWTSLPILSYCFVK